MRVRVRVRVNVRVMQAGVAMPARASQVGARSTLVPGLGWAVLVSAWAADRGVSVRMLVPGLGSDRGVRVLVSVSE